MEVKGPKKQILFIGIGLLILGIVLRKLSGYPTAGLLLILSGVALKTFYIIRAARSGLYRPGRELWFLLLGLSLFLGGLYLRGSDFFFDPVYLIVLGLTLKILFIFRFIQIVRARRQEMNS